MRLWWLTGWSYLCDHNERLPNWSQKKKQTLRLWVYRSLTWRDGSWYGSALHIILNSNNTDVVFHSWTEVLQGAGVLPTLHELLHTVSLLPIGGSAGNFVASDV